MEHISNLMPVSQEPAMPVLRQSATGGKLEVALQSKTIIHLADPEPIYQALRYAMVLVGLRAANLPADYERAILVNYIQNHYGGHTPEEIKLAFEMAVAGQLDIDDVTCYENFSVLYFSKIMNAYREWAREEYKNVTLPAKSFPDWEKEKYFMLQRDREHIEVYYQQILQITKIIPEEIPDYFKDILVSDGLMKEDDDLKTFFRTRIEKGIANIYVRQQ